MTIRQSNPKRVEDNMTKKTISFIGAAVLALALVACGGSGKADNTTPKAAPMAGDGGTAMTPSGNPCAAPTGGTTPAGNPCGK
jgi:hypothetical protein